MFELFDYAALPRKRTCLSLFNFNRPCLLVSPFALAAAEVVVPSRVGGGVCAPNVGGGVKKNVGGGVKKNVGGAVGGGDGDGV